MNTIEQNIATVRGLYEAFSRRDIPAILGMLREDVEWSEPENPHNPCGGAHHGHDGFLEWAETGRAAEDILALDVQRMLADGESVAVVGHTKIRAIPTGRVYESDFVHFITLSDGKVAKFQEFFDTYAAGEAFH